MVNLGLGLCSLGTQPSRHGNCPLKDGWVLHPWSGSNFVAALRMVRESMALAELRIWNLVQDSPSSRRARKLNQKSLRHGAGQVRSTFTRMGSTPISLLTCCSVSASRTTFSTM